MNELVLLVDDEPALLEALSLYLTRRKYRVRTALSAGEALDTIARETPAAVVTDISMDGREAGIELTERIRREHPEVPVILMSAQASSEGLGRALNAHASGFLEKPFANDALIRVLEEALVRARVVRQAHDTATSRSRQAQSRRHNQGQGRQAETATHISDDPEGVGISEAWLNAVSLVDAAATSMATVLLEGESGTGKGVLAHRIHSLSPRALKPFISLNCGAVGPEGLIESQLFGHVRGAFTGAEKEASGLLRAADGGTLFLDEVAELPTAVQVALLRVLQEHEVRALGSTETHKVDIRIVAATNKSLADAVRQEKFRADLFWRLSVISVTVPPLRERVSDLPVLVDTLLARHRARDASLTAQGLDEDALNAVAVYTWPGNVRELDNALWAAAVRARGSIHISVADLPPSVVRPEPRAIQLGGALENIPTLATIEQAYAAWVLAKAGGDLAAAAVRLEVPVGVLSQILNSGRNENS